MREKKITGKLRKLKKNMYILEETLKVHFSKNLYLTVYTYRFDHNFPLSKLVKVILISAVKMKENWLYYGKSEFKD